MDFRPNIVVFMTDQQNFKSLYGSHRAITPNLDKFRQNAIFFHQSYCTSPHCCPSRASFFSGLYPSQHGVWNNVEVDNALSRGLFDDVILFPERLQQSGYRTLFSGKWHVSAYESPTDRGFDENLHEHISNYGRFAPENQPRHKDWENVFQRPLPKCMIPEFGCLCREGYPKYQQFSVKEDAYGDQITVNRACEAIQSHNWKKPLFLYVGTTGPHDPYTPPQEYLDMYQNWDIHLPNNFEDSLSDKPNLYRRTQNRYALSREEHIESLRHYLAFVSFEDALFGQLLRTLEESGQMDNTYLIYLSDHGDYASAHGLWSKGLPCFQEAYHIPALVGGAGIHGETPVDAMVSITDFAPTILELAGISAPDVAGRSLVPFLRHQIPCDWRTELFTQSNGNELYGIQRAVWNKKWKYVFNGFDYDELYDLENDPGELHNLIYDPSLAAIVREMCGKLWQFAYQTGDACTCPYIMVSLAPYGPGIIWENVL